MKTTELISYIFGGSAYGFPAIFGAWLDSALAFHAFAETYRDKIRKKVHLVRDAETRCDLLAELAVAYWLIQDRRLALAYEVYSAGKTRGPDFTATFRTHTPFNVEVTRLRTAGAETPLAPTYPLQKLVTTLCAKLPQLPPSICNVLVLATENAMFQPSDLLAATRLLSERLAQRDDAFFQRYGFQGASDFRHQFPRLSGVVLRAGPRCGEYAPAGFWPNPTARHPLPAEIATLLQR